MLEKRPQGATAHTETTNSGFSGLLWMLFGAILTLVIGVFLYKSPIFGFSNIEPQVVQSDEPTVQPKVQADKDNPNYQFYDLLPEQKSQRIPDISHNSKGLQESIEKKAKNLKPDVVIKQPLAGLQQEEANQKNQATGNQATSSLLNNTASANTNKKNSKPVAGDGEMIITYENSTYGDADILDTIGASGNAVEPVITTLTQVKQESTGTTAKIVSPLTITETSTQTTNQGTAQTTPTKKLAKAPTSSGSIIKEVKENGTTKIQTATQAEQKAKPRKSYILQINTYDNADEADTRRAQVLMTGVDAQVSKKQVNEQIVYQVITTQMTSPEAVVRAQQNLQKNGIGSIVVEQRAE